MTTLEPYDGRDVIGCALALTGAGDGLSQAMRISPRPFHIGDRVTIVMEAVVRAAKHEPAVRDDLDGPLRFVAVLRAETAMLTDAPGVVKLLDKHKAAVAKATQIEGQRSIEDEIGEDADGDE